MKSYPWAIFLVPLALFLVVGSFEPGPPDPAKPSATWVPYAWYPWVYTLKIALVTLSLAVLWPGLRQFPVRLPGWGILVGVAGVVLWVGLCELHLEERLAAALGLEKYLAMGARSAFNPFAQFPDRPWVAWVFLAIRFFGLAAVVPVAEELFLRGFVMRACVDPDTWWEVPFGKVNPVAIAAGTLVPMLMHPGELLAAAAWFSLVTWLMVRTRSFWDCVAAHAVTNFLLGVYVLASGHWWLM